MSEYTVTTLWEEIEKSVDSVNYTRYITIDENETPVRLSGPAETWVPVIDYEFMPDSCTVVMMVPNNWKEYARCVRPSNGKKRRIDQ